MAEVLAQATGSGIDAPNAAPADHAWTAAACQSGIWFSPAGPTLGTLADLAQQVRPLVQASVPGTVGTAPFGSNVRAIVVNVDPDRAPISRPTTWLEHWRRERDHPAGNLYVKDQMPLVPSSTLITHQEIGSIPVKQASTSISVTSPRSPTAPT